MDINTRPTAQASADAGVVGAGTTVTLNGSASAAAAAFAWAQIAGPAVVLSTANAASTTFVAANPDGPFAMASFQLRGHDVCGSTDTTTAEVVIVGN